MPKSTITFQLQNTNEMRKVLTKLAQYVIQCQNGDSDPEELEAHIEFHDKVISAINSK